jgi:hypothetical protein
VAVVAHPDIAKTFLTEKLNVAGLLALTVTTFGAARAVQGVFYMIAPQEQPNPYPNVIINTPITIAAAPPICINGLVFSQATFEIDVRVGAKDVEPDDAGLLAIRAKVIELAHAKSGAVTGGRVNSCAVYSARPFTPAQRVDKGTYIYSEIGVTFRVAAEVS